MEREKLGENWSGGCLFRGWNEGENGVNKLHCESFDNFYEKYKKLLKKLIALLFSYKMFIKIIYKLIFLGHTLTFPLIFFFF